MIVRSSAGGDIMKTCTIRMGFGAGALAATLLFPGSIFAQQMTYQLLGIKAEAAPAAPAPANSCTAHNWMSSIGACGRDLVSKIAPRAEREVHAEALEPGVSTVAATGATADVPVTRAATESPAPRSEALAAIESPAPGPREPGYVRSSGRDPQAGSSRSPDLLLRIGSKHRFRGNEEAGFSDTVYENHVQNNGHKAVGVELLVPFQ